MTSDRGGRLDPWGGPLPLGGLGGRSRPKTGRPADEMTALAPSQAKKSFNRTLLLCSAAPGAHSTSAALQRDNICTTTPVQPPRHYHHRRPLTPSGLLDHFCPPSSPHARERSCSAKNPSVDTARATPCLLPHRLHCQLQAPARHVEENLLRRHQRRCPKGRASLVYVAVVRIPLLLGRETKNKALTFPLATTAYDKQKDLLSSETGHFSLIRAMHLADLITEMNGTRRPKQAVTAPSIY